MPYLRIFREISFFFSKLIGAVDGVLPEVELESRVRRLCLLGVELKVVREEAEHERGAGG